MDSLFILIPIAVVFVAIAAKVFFWAVDNNQFDDLDTEGQRILFEEDVKAVKTPKSSDASSAAKDDTST